MPPELLADLLGAPYVLGGSDPAAGIDCAGLCWLILRRAGWDLPPLPDPDAAGAWAGAARAWFARCGDFFAEMPWPTPGGARAYDVLEAAPRPGADWDQAGTRLGADGAQSGQAAAHDLHLSIVVQEAPPAVLTATGSLGVVRVRLAAITGIRRLLRPRPEAGRGSAA